MKTPLFFKKYLFLFSISLYSFAQAQTQFGLRVAPGISFNQAENEAYYSQYAPVGKPGFGGSIGPTADFFLNRSLSISTGLWYTVKAANIDFNQTMVVYYYGNTFAIIYDNASSQYTLGYLQLPLTLKGYTKESSLGIRFYAQAGGSFDLKTGEKARSADQNVLFQLMEAMNVEESVFKANAWSLYAGLGLEKKAGDRTLFFAGLSYQRTMSNQVNSQHYERFFFPPVSIRSQLLALEMGVKF